MSKKDMSISCNIEDQDKFNIEIYGDDKREKVAVWLKLDGVDTTCIAITNQQAKFLRDFLNEHII